MQNPKPKPPLTAGRAVRNVGVAVATLTGVGAVATLGSGAAALSGFSTLATGLGAVSTGVGFIPGVGALVTAASASFGVLAGPVISAVGTLGMGMAAPAVIGAAMVVGATLLARGIFKAVGKMIDKALPAKAPATPSAGQVRQLNPNVRVAGQGMDGLGGQVRPINQMKEKSEANNKARQAVNKSNINLNNIRPIQQGDYTAPPSGKSNSESASRGAQRAS